jgi:photosystem II stability/assembly factor-like uncharacterized protein
MKIINAEFLLTLWALLSSPLLAQDFWGPTLGPLADPYVYSLAMDSSGDMFAGTFYGVFKSTDQGLAFVKLGLQDVIYSLAVSPNGEVYAGTWGAGVYRSRDKGSTWTQVNNGLTSGLIRSLAINPSGYIFAGTSDSGAFISTNAGANWTQVGGGLKQTNVLSLAVSPNGSVFAGTAAAGLFRSTDAGRTWDKVGLEGYRIFSLGCGADGTILAGSDASFIFRSPDNGSSWTTHNLPPTPWKGKFYASTIVGIAFNQNQQVFASTWQGVARSTDNGNTWTVASLSSEDSVDFVRSLAVDRSGNIYAGTNLQGVYRSRDDGLSWEQMFDRFAAAPYSVTAIGINANGYIFAATYGDGVFRSTDNGTDWKQVNTGLGKTLVLCLAVNSAGHVFVGTQYGGVFRSTNNGMSWDQTNNGLSDSVVYSLAINGKGDIFAGTAGGAIFRSVDNGQNWLQVKTGDVWSFAISSNGDIFAGSSRIFRSTDNGASWTELLDSPFARALAIDSSGRVFAGGDYYPGHIFRSIDNGQTWTQVATTGLNKPVQALVANPIGVVFAGVYAYGMGGGVLRSKDAGESWTQVNSGLTDTDIHSLAIDSRGYLLAGTARGGVFMSTKPTTLDLPPSVFRLLLSVTGDTLTLTFPVKPVKFSWHASIDPDPGDIVKYGLRLTGAGIDTTIAGFRDTTVSLDIMSRLKPGGAYSWYVRATDGLLETSSDTARFFTFSQVVAVERNKVDAPRSFALGQNYPNPFNPTTTIEFALPKSAFVTLRVYDVLGRQVGKLVNKKLSPGTYTRQWDARDLASGVYFYRLSAGEFSQTKKLILLR